MAKLRVGVVGTGNIAQNAHLRVYEDLKDEVEVVAVADINLERAQEAAKKFGVPEAFASVDELLEKVDVDYIDVCVWNAWHEDVVVKALEAGKAVLCEKPMASSVEGAERMAAAVKKHGKPFMMAMMTRFGNDVQLLREKIESGELGEIYLAKTGYIRRRGTPIGWFTDTTKSGGGPIIDIGVHNLDMTWYLMGRPKPVRVSARTANKIGNFETRGVSRWEALDSDVTAFDTEDSAVGLIHFENGATLFLEVSWAINGEPRNYTEIYGSKAGAKLNPLTIYGENDQKYLKDEVAELPDNNRYEAEIRHFIECLREGKEPMATVDDGLTVQKMLGAMYQSCKENREITL